MRCSKITFETKAEALAEIKLQRSQCIHHSKKAGKRHKNGRKTYPYLCHNCNRFHLTTKNQKLYKKELVKKKRDKESDV